MTKRRKGGSGGDKRNNNKEEEGNQSDTASLTIFGKLCGPVREEGGIRAGVNG